MAMESSSVFDALQALFKHMESESNRVTRSVDLELWAHRARHGRDEASESAMDLLEEVQEKRRQIEQMTRQLSKHNDETEAKLEMFVEEVTKAWQKVQRAEAHAAEYGFQPVLGETACPLKLTLDKYKEASRNDEKVGQEGNSSKKDGHNNEEDDDEQRERNKLGDQSSCSSEQAKECSPKSPERGSEADKENFEPKSSEKKVHGKSDKKTEKRPEENAESVKGSGIPRNVVTPHDDYGRNPKEHNYEEKKREEECDNPISILKKNFEEKKSNYVTMTDHDETLNLDGDDPTLIIHQKSLPVALDQDDELPEDDIEASRVEISPGLFTRKPASREKGRTSHKHRDETSRETPPVPQFATFDLQSNMSALKDKAQPPDAQHNNTPKGSTIEDKDVAKGVTAAWSTNSFESPPIPELLTVDLKKILSKKADTPSEIGTPPSESPELPLLSDRKMNESLARSVKKKTPLK